MFNDIFYWIVSFFNFGYIKMDWCNKYDVRGCDCGQKLLVL